MTFQIALALWQFGLWLGVALMAGVCFGLGAMALVTATGADRYLGQEDLGQLRDELVAAVELLERERRQSAIIRELLQVEPALHQTLFECTLDRIRSLITSATLRSKRIAGDTVLAWLINDHDTTWATVKAAERDSAIANGALVIDLAPATSVCCNQDCNQGRERPVRKLGIHE